MMEITTRGTGGLKKQLLRIEKDIEKQTSEGLAIDVYTLERNIAISSPVDTGRYRLAWETIRKGPREWEIHNSVEYAKYLIYGTINGPILHDVRGIVRYWNNHIRGKVQSKFK